MKSVDALRYGFDASTGCSGWDYDVHILLRNRTNKLDSNLVLAPSYSLDGSSRDTIQFSFSPTYVNTWDSVSGDTAIANDTLVLVWYQDAIFDPLATDTQYVYAANYYNMTYDSAGAVIDSVWVAADTNLYLSNTDTYNIYEIIEDFELGRNYYSLWYIYEPCQWQLWHQWIR